MKQILANAKQIYNYLSQSKTIENPDFILILGSSDLSVPEFAAKYIKNTEAEVIIISGGLGKDTRYLWNISEAQMFYEVLKKHKCCSQKRIYLEEKATNTGENILFSRDLILKHQLKHERGLLITKPYMTRRALNTAAKQWPEVNWGSVAEIVSFEDYFGEIENKERFLNLLVGDLQRIKIYAEKGFQIEDHIPAEVWDSFIYLSEKGYNRFVIQPQ